jgi:predicted component of type VI protein secretion system
VVGIVDAVQVELHALAGMLEEHSAGDLLLMLSRRLAVASLLLRRADGRAPEPLEWDPDAETATSGPDDDEGDA